jgi:hypothetical protein
MMSFSSDAAVADVEMRAVLFVLLGFAYIDGEFDSTERAFVRDFADKLVARRAVEMFASDAASRGYALPRWRAHYYQVMEGIEHEIRGYLTESVAEGESAAGFVVAKLKLRCFELLGRISEHNRAALLATVDELMRADGVVHPNEQRFRDDLESLFSGEGEELTAIFSPQSVSFRHGFAVLEPARPQPPRVYDHVFFKNFEWSQGGDPAAVVRHAATDIDLMRRVESKLHELRARGEGRLGDAQNFNVFAGQDPFLDGHVHVVPPKPGRVYELLVLGDLHGCYSCLKAALLQVDFFSKVEAFRADPVNNPEMMLVLLGDYIDRGRFSYDGIFRTVMRLFLAAPEHVFFLRGNHEHYYQKDGAVASPVRPAEAIGSIAAVAPRELLESYMRLFEVLPNVLVFGRTLFVHAGIPRHDTIEEKLGTLAGLNDPKVRLQMLWSDPSDAEFIPLELQRQNARFPYGREQFRAFMTQIGCSLMVRGHERVVEGVRKVYDDPRAALISLFSAGGAQNEDLPPGSNYREVTPMALSIRHQDGLNRMTPFPIAYERFNDPLLNAFFSPVKSG